MKKSLILAIVLSLAAVSIPGVSEAAGYIVITTPAPLPSAAVDRYFFSTIDFVNTTGYAASVIVDGLPAGLSPNYIPNISETYGSFTISGVPTAAGFYAVTVFLTNYAGESTSQSFSLIVAQNSRFEITTSFPAGPAFSFSQSSFDFYYTIGGSAPAIQSLVFNNVTNSPVDFWLSLDSRPSWLNSSYNENMMTAYPGSPFGLGAGVNPAGLPPGTYQTNIRLIGSFSGSPIIIPIRLTVFGVFGITTPPPPLPAIMPPMPVPPAPVFGNRTALIRLYNSRIENHLYTTDRAEALSAASYAGYVYEGDMGYVYSSSQASTEPVYRLYNARMNNHFYTTKSEEVLSAQYGGFTLEGIIGYVPAAAASGLDKQIYRLYNARSGDHFYTVDEYERQLMMARGYVWEGSLGGRDVNWLLGTP